MPYGMYISAEGAFAQSERLKVVANNLANVDTTGYKRDVAVFQARYCEAIARGMNQPGAGGVDDLSGGVKAIGTKTDFSQGLLKYTGRSSDLAIDGDGYFVVLHNKQNLLTRAGNFSINSAGMLVTAAGDPVIGDGNVPIVIDPDAGPWSISPDGTLEQDGNLFPLAMVRPQHKSDLAKVGYNLFIPLAKTQILQPGERRIATGFLEGSTVEPTMEMMELIEASRGFEANANMIRNQDQMLGTLISRVLKET